MMTDKPRIDLPVPDITPYKEGNTGIDYLHRFDSGVGGPHVMITALVHGNEICGAIALDWLLRENIRPIRGVMSLCFVNWLAFQGFDPETPFASRYVDEDFNRLWTAEVLEGPGDSHELRRAREIRPTVDTVDHLLDLHSTSRALDAILLAGPAEKGRVLARLIGVPGIVVSDAGHAAGRRLRDYDAFSDVTSPKTAALVECGPHWRHGTDKMALSASVRFLTALGAVEPTLQDRLPGPADEESQRFIEVTGPVTVRTDEFRFTEMWGGMEVIAAEGTVIGYDGDTPVRTPYDNCVLVQPAREAGKGRTAVRFGQEI